MLKEAYGVFLVWIVWDGYSVGCKYEAIRVGDCANKITLSITTVIRKANNKRFSCED